MFSKLKPELKQIIRGKWVVGNIEIECLKAFYRFHYFSP